MPKVVDHEQRRSELIQATWEVIASEGLEAVTMRRVAEFAGCTTGRITHHFDNRDDLLVAALRTAHHAAGERMRVAASGSSNPTNRLTAVALQALPLDATRVREWRLWLAFWNSAVNDRRLANENAQRYREWHALVERLLTPILAKGEVSQEARTLIALIDGLGLNGVLQPTKPNRADIQATVSRYITRLAAAP